MFKGASAQIFGNAAELRKKMTKAENILWEKLRNKMFHGLKFRRQHPINKYIADFYCHKLKLIIELDGEYHNSEDQIIKDQNRTEILNFNDVKVIRFSNMDVETNIEKVLSDIEGYI